MDNASSPAVMGKLQGPFGTPGSSETVAAGFMSIGNSTYYRYVFYATVWAAQGRLSTLRVFLCKSVLYGAFVWVQGA
jgi:hypothetical protein